MKNKSQINRLTKLNGWERTKNTTNELETALIEYFGEDDYKMLMNNLDALYYLRSFKYSKFLLGSRELDIMEDFLFDLKNRLEM